MTPLLKFTTLRIALFVAALVVLALLGARGWLLLLLAAFVSLALSFVLLRGPRQELAESIAARSSNRSRQRAAHRGVDEDAAVEDAEVENGQSQRDERP